MCMLKYLLCPVISVISTVTFASPLLGISSDGNTDQYEISDVRSIKFAPHKDGYKGYSVIKFNAEKTGFETTNSNNITVYPNPVSEYLSISGIDESEQIIITDSQGKDIFKKSGSFIDVKNLPAGIYILTVKSKQIKFIKK